MQMPSKMNIRRHQVQRENIFGNPHRLRTSAHRACGWQSTLASPARLLDPGFRQDHS
jgi:hypothetical protein